jgi:hypothetical protein
VKITCPRCRNIVAEHRLRDGLHIVSIRTWRRNSYTVEGTVEQLAAIRLTVQCGMAECGHRWDICASVVETVRKGEASERRAETKTDADHQTAIIR